MLTNIHLTIRWKIKAVRQKNMHPQSEQMYITWKNLVLWKHTRVPNPKPLVANRGWRNCSTHSPYSCHQEPGVTGPVCSPHHTGHVLKGPIKVMTPGVCNCGSASLLSLIGLLVCFPSFFFFLLKVCSQFLPHSLNILTCSLFTSYLIILFLISIALSTPSFMSLSPPCECEYVCLTVFSGKMRAHFGQNQLTQESLYGPYLYEHCKCKLKNNVCGAALLLGFPKYSGQIVFARHYERHYPSFWMSSVIGIRGTKVQKIDFDSDSIKSGQLQYFFSFLCWH